MGILGAGSEGGWVSCACVCSFGVLCQNVSVSVRCVVCGTFFVMRVGGEDKR
jgi:hypothetical protein